MQRVRQDDDDDVGLRLEHGSVIDEAPDVIGRRPFIQPPAIHVAHSGDLESVELVHGVSVHACNRAETDEGGLKGRGGS